MNKSFDDCLKDGVGTIYADWEECEFRCLILRGPHSLCAYIGVKPGHPLYGKGYFDLPSDADVHGGLTFAKEGDGDKWPSGYWWFGWDYGHAGDVLMIENPFRSGFSQFHDIRWTPDMVKTGFPNAIKSLREIANSLI